MKVILRGKQSGKTSDIIRIAALLDMQILTVDRARADFIKRQADLMQMKIRRPLPINELLEKGRMDGKEWPRDVLIDDADAVLERLVMPARLHAVTMTDYGAGRDE